MPKKNSEKPETVKELQAINRGLTVLIEAMEIILKNKEHLMVDVTGKGLGFADYLEALGIKIERVMPEPGSDRSLFRVYGNGL
jgi:hypothetical protein